MWGATTTMSKYIEREEISIHAPRVGRDFQRAQCSEVHHISIHAPRVGRDRDRLCNKMSDIAISIHAPRVGRDGETVQMMIDAG